MTTTSTYPFVTTVHRPGLPDVQLGFVYQHQVEHASWSLASDLRNTQHVEGTTITWGATPDSATPLAPVSTDPFEVALLLEQQDLNQPIGHAFPDLYSRLKAQEGYETTLRIWGSACSWLCRDDPEN